MKVCIVGAGTAGICAARNCLEKSFDVTIYEQTDKIGGTWVYTDEVGVNRYGVDVHSSMYKGLRTNLPKEIMGFPDFNITQPEYSYIPSEDMLRYLESYANHFQIRDHVKFLHHVIRVLKKGLKWQVITKKLENSEYTEELFDFVIICNGHYHTPETPEIQGSEHFNGKILHSHDYKSTDGFEDEDVLVIGAGPSGMDLCHEISKVARKVTLSHHLPSLPKTEFRDNVSMKPDVREVTAQGIIFTDGSKETFSIIFLCTGYKYAFPFLSVDCGIKSDNNFVRPLYKHVLNINHPSMAFIGIPFYVCAAQMMDLQMRFVLKFWCGEKQLPSKKEMLEDMEKDMDRRWKKGYKKRQAHMMGPDQFDYYEDLARTAEIKPIFPVMTKIHNESSDRFVDDLLMFRRDVFYIVDSETFSVERR